MRYKLQEIQDGTGFDPAVQFVTAEGFDEACDRMRHIVDHCLATHDSDSGLMPDLEAMRVWLDSQQLASGWMGQRCNHDVPALDAHGVCECGSTLAQRMTELLKDELSRDDSSAHDIALTLADEAQRSLTS